MADRYPSEYDLCDCGHSRSRHRNTRVDEWWDCDVGWDEYPGCPCQQFQLKMAVDPRPAQELGQGDAIIVTALRGPSHFEQAVVDTVVFEVNPQDGPRIRIRDTSGRFHYWKREDEVLVYSEVSS